ncbi:MAG: hypothetical protein KDB05_06390 [Planctomycetales bacterium]|nr:hypothetical protein [Planctomycetales bacterium]
MMKRDELRRPFATVSSELLSHSERSQVLMGGDLADAIVERLFPRGNSC